jgi:hypothetical protein
VHDRAAPLFADVTNLIHCSDNPRGRPKGRKNRRTLLNRMVKRYEKNTGKSAALARTGASFERVSEQLTILRRPQTPTENV